MKNTSKFLIVAIIFGCACNSNSSKLSGVWKMYSYKRTNDTTEQIQNENSSNEYIAFHKGSFLKYSNDNCTSSDWFKFGRKLELTTDTIKGFSKEKDFEHIMHDKFSYKLINDSTLQLGIIYDNKLIETRTYKYNGDFID